MNTEKLMINLKKIDLEELKIISKIIKKGSFFLFFWLFDLHACERKRHSQPIICWVSHFVYVPYNIDSSFTLFVQLSLNSFYFLVSDVWSKVY